MANCKSCDHFGDCSTRGRTPDEPACPELRLRLCGQCTMLDKCSKEHGVVCTTEACLNWISNGKDPLYDTIRTCFEQSVLPALKDGTHTSDPDVIKNIEYLARNLGSLINKPTPEDINLERTFMEIIFEDYETDKALDAAATTVNQILQAEGVNVPFKSGTVTAIAKTVSEVKFIYKISLACGLSGYIDQIMAKVIDTKFGSNPGQIKI